MWLKSEENEADAPSRALGWRTDRVVNAAFVRIGGERGEVFTLDLTSSLVAAREQRLVGGVAREARWVPLPYRWAEG
jgi:hypothetical protein